MAFGRNMGKRMSSISPTITTTAAKIDTRTRDDGSPSRPAGEARRAALRKTGYPNPTRPPFRGGF